MRGKKNPTAKDQCRLADIGIFYFFFISRVCFIVRGALFTVFRAKKNSCHIKFGKKKWRFENKVKNKLETGMPPPGFCQKIYIICLFDRNQNLLLCTPLVYIHEHGPYKTFKQM